MRAAIGPGGTPSGRHQRRVLAGFRPTWRQALAHGLRLGGVGSVLLGAVAVGWAASAGVARPPPVTVVAAAVPGAPDAPELAWLTVLAPLPLGLLAGAAVRIRVRVRLDESGVFSRRFGAGRFAPWPAVVDVRAERRRGRTVVAVYLADGPPLRLAAPYDAGRLGADPRFEQKLFVICHVWATYRRSSGPVATAPAPHRGFGWHRVAAWVAPRRGSPSRSKWPGTRYG
jgi:hypothetical protein